MLSPLTLYIKRGLKNCYMPQKDCWSYIYHLDGRAEPNESRDPYDVFYSLNVILGLASVGEEAWKGDYDLPALLHKNTRRLVAEPALTYAYGMALWASAVLRTPLEKEVEDFLLAFLQRRKNWRKFSAQDIGMILTGICEQHRVGNTNFDALAPELFDRIRKKYTADKGLFCNAPCCLRKRFASFATQTYLTTACYHYGAAFCVEEASVLADTVTRKMLSLQGPNGEWPWFYYAPKGIVVDNYEVYSVHQDGMAALFLSFAEKRGVAGAREATIKGFNWIFGANQLGKNMMLPELGLFYRSILRKGEYNCKVWRVVRSIVNALLGRTDTYDKPENLTLRLECRSYHLGWVLYSFGRRDDLLEIISHPDFVAATKA